MIENLIVALIVALALAYAIWKFTPKAARERVAPHLAVLGRRLGLSQVNALRLEAKLVTAGACGSCNSCNACATDPEVAGEASHPSAGAGSEASPRRIIPIRRGTSRS